MGDLKGAGLDFTTADRTAMHRLTAHGQNFDVAWTTGQSVISAGEAGIGSGLLAQAFRLSYQAVEQELKSSATKVPGICRHCADVGHLSADAYDRYDQAAARRFDPR